MASCSCLRGPRQRMKTERSKYKVLGRRVGGFDPPFFLVCFGGFEVAVAKGLDAEAPPANKAPDDDRDALLQRSISNACCSSPPALTKASRTKRSSNPMENISGVFLELNFLGGAVASGYRPSISISIAACSLPPALTSARCTSASSNPIENIMRRDDDGVYLQQT